MRLNCKVSVVALESIMQALASSDGSDKKRARCLLGDRHWKFPKYKPRGG